ncbi:MAG: endolytic transglycosylase MltG [Elusimicrobiota bacterium]|nr:endolytic transglycosylase MltG [Elusimicrobiota bacterium]
MNKTIKIIGFVILCLTVATLLYYNSLPDKEIIVKIPEGLSAKAIADILYNNKLIASKKLFLLISALTSSSKKFQAGTYKFTSKMNFVKIMSILRKGKTLNIKLTIPEGFTAEQIGSLIEEKKLGKRDTFLKIVTKTNLEGYLFPETYFIPPEITEQKIIDIMLDRFRKNYTRELELQAKKIKFNTHQVVTLASIIEKEAKDEKERKIISAVFHNRLKNGWNLESCATVRYALKKYSDKLTYKDLRVNSPYNTYKFRGLPPGPICNPGLASIKAALFPAESDLMFFFSDGEGTHKFSKYYKHHIEGQMSK